MRSHSYFACTAGRKRTLGVSCAVTALSGMCSAVAPSFWWYFVFRVFTGATVAGIISTGVLLAVEPVGPTYRGTAILSTGEPLQPSTLSSVKALSRIYGQKGMERALHGSPILVLNILR